MKHAYISILLVNFCLLACSFAATAQAVEWDKTIGGSNDDFLETISAADGGYLLGGTSSSNASGNKSEDNRGGLDYWIVKVDESGNKLWDKTYGGSDNDQLTRIISTAEGGYLLAGHSDSPASGDKSEGSRGYRDYWIIKIDASGNKEWDKTFGGLSYDDLSGVISTADGGYLLAGESYSPASGDKSEESIGGCGYEDLCSTDIWIVKIDESGNKLWDKTFGGNSNDGISDIITTSDGNYLLAGYSFSNASGDKSEDNRGLMDYWIVKIDESGNKLWDRTYGGSDSDLLKSVITTPDGGYMLAGNSLSNASGDKSEDSKNSPLNINYYDYWIIKIDANGNKEWDKTFGGESHDQPSSVTTTPDGGYLLAGWSWSEASGDKSEDNRGVGADYWIVKTDERGNKQWDKTIGGNHDDQLFSAIATADGGYLLGGYSRSNTSGDKTEDSKGDSDFWIVKVVETEKDFSIKSFALINAESDTEIQTIHSIHSGEVIDLANLSSSKLSIVAITEPETVGSVAFNLTGPFRHGHTENYAPYALFGDQAGDFAGRLFPPGKYTLIATPYDEKEKAGIAGRALTIHFTIINSKEIEDAQVTGFDLYDAVTDQKIKELTDGGVIHQDELSHNELTVLIHTVPDFVGSVKVELWGPRSLTRIENTKPYTLFRNNSKDLFGEVLPAGEYRLKATPYPEANAQGEAGELLEVSFIVVGGNSNGRLAAYPIPTAGVVYISYQGSAESADLMLLDFSGQPLLTLPLKEQTQLDMSSYRKGIYYLKVVDQQGVHLKRVVVE